MKIKFSSITKPDIKLNVRVNEKEKWKFFHDYHYMTCNKDVKKSFPNGAKFYTFYWVRDKREILVGCLGVLFQISPYPAKRLTRIVVLPEFQGLGIASKMVNSISEYYSYLGFRMYGSTFHPRLGNFWENSKSWKAGMYNQKQFRKTENHVEKSMSGLRDGISMYRYVYSPGSYDLLYCPYNYDKINKRMLEIEKHMTPELEDEYIKLRNEMKEIHNLMEFGTLDRNIIYADNLSDEENMKYVKKKKPKIDRKLIKEVMKKYNCSSVLAQKRIENENFED